MAPEPPRTVTTARPPATHHFLLVTPVETGNPPGSPEPAAPVQPTRFVSRSSTRAQSLAYRLVAQPPAPDAVPPPGPSGFDMVANRTWLAEVDGTTVLTVECEVRSAAPEPIGGVELELLEADLTELATRVAVDVLGCTRESVAWVGRYALSEPPAGWLGAETVRRPLNGSSETAVIGGWGNGAVTGWSLLDDGARGEVVRGLVDAQYLWHQVDELSRRSLDIVRGFRTPHARVRARDLRRVQRAVEAEWTALAQHHAAADDLFLNVQGVRRTTALAILEAWQYEDVMARVGRRIADAHDVVSRKRERFERRYQSTVEAVLFVLGLLTFVEIVLAAISTAYSGPVDTVPGAGVGLFAWLRSTSSDTLVLGTAGLVLVAALLVVARRRT